MSAVDIVSRALCWIIVISGCAAVIYDTVSRIVEDERRRRHGNTR